MKFLVVIAAFLAVATAVQVRDKRGLLASTVLAGPSGTILASPGVVASPLLARSVLAPGLVAPGLVAPGLATVLAAPGVTAGTVVAPGATLVGPSTNGLPGAVISNGLLGPQILI